MGKSARSKKSCFEDGDCDPDGTNSDTQSVQKELSGEKITSDKKNRKKGQKSDANISEEVTSSPVTESKSKKKAQRREGRKKDVESDDQDPLKREVENLELHEDVPKKKASKKAGRKKFVDSDDEDPLKREIENLELDNEMPKKKAPKKAGRKKAVDSDDEDPLKREIENLELDDEMPKKKAPKKAGRKKAVDSDNKETIEQEIKNLELSEISKKKANKKPARKKADRDSLSQELENVDSEEDSKEDTFDKPIQGKEVSTGSDKKKTKKTKKGLVIDEYDQQMDSIMNDLKNENLNKTESGINDKKEAGGDHEQIFQNENAQGDVREREEHSKAEALSDSKESNKKVGELERIFGKRKGKKSGKDSVNGSTEVKEELDTETRESNALHEPNVIEGESDQILGKTKEVSDIGSSNKGSGPKKISRRDKIAKSNIESRKKKKNTAEKAALEVEVVEEEVEEESSKILESVMRKSISGFASGYAEGEIGASASESISANGILTANVGGEDVQIKSLSIQAHGKQLIIDSDISLIKGQRYGLIAPNGSGKSTLLSAIACGLLPLPSKITVYLLDREFKPSEITALEAVLDIAKQEMDYLLDQSMKYSQKYDKYQDVFDQIQTRIADLSEEGSEVRAKHILKGLGFTDSLMEHKTKNLSGGWRMRVSLARILFVKPSLMLLDEPTNHLDIESVAWLEDYLVNETPNTIILMTSHSQDTLNEVCTNIIQLYDRRLYAYNGNYNFFCKARAEREALIKKKTSAYEKQKQKIKESLGTTSGKKHTQAKQRAKILEKTMSKKIEENQVLEEKIVYTKELKLRFGECGGGLPSPLLSFKEVCFGYSPDKILFKNLNFGLDLKSRVALVGVNGSGKSTILNLMLRKLKPLSGCVEARSGLRCALFSQNLSDQLDFERSPVKWLCEQFKEYKEQEMRGILGRYGLTGKSQVIQIKKLSDGQRRRVLFAYLGLYRPHMIFMDEPTNALDIDTIDDLGDAIEEFDGGVVVISHDFRLIERIAESVWVVENGDIFDFPGEIRDYKMSIRQKCEQERNMRLQGADGNS